MVFYLEQTVGNPTFKSANRTPVQLLTESTYSGTLMDIPDH